MPELPEVETVVRGLRSRLEGRRVGELVFLSPHLGQKQPLPALGPDLYRGRKIDKIWRRGKMIIFNFSGGCGLLIHLKMTGQLYLCSPKHPVDKHTHARMTFADLSSELRFRDIRKFGFLNCLPTTEILTRVNSELGPEPLDLDFSGFQSRLKKHGGKKIKGWLLDQKIVAGIGNIYSDEILIRARIRPDRLADRLSPEETRRLFRAMKFVLRKAIELRGSSISDYVDSKGEKGKFQQKHLVYGREGLLCRRCRKTVIRRKKIAGRSSFFCPHCQK
ncbi:MAG: bifunctional DNA-formamidopyrimidine glycosylase/DNA-(apurinic or apyrimidinic site) lyase [Candidatus Saccharicenans sp.]|nr:bifunctional DNA-formamidopyrimidine glycosylase/DNA-(apurinic or apyrimidinic site) lyase [Candidatus Saccharicenans sp.]